MVKKIISNHKSYFWMEQYHYDPHDVRGRCERCQSPNLYVRGSGFTFVAIADREVRLGGHRGKAGSTVINAPLKIGNKIRLDLNPHISLDNFCKKSQPLRPTDSEWMFPEEKYFHKWKFTPRAIHKSKILIPRQTPWTLAEQGHQIAPVSNRCHAALT